MDPNQAGTIISETMTPAPELPANKVDQIARETFHPEATKETVTIGGREFKVVMLPWGVEGQMLDIIAPYLRLLVDAAAVEQFEGVLGALLIEARHDLNALAIMILSHQWKKEPEFQPDAGEHPQTTAQKIDAWLAENAHFSEIAELVLAQVKRNKVADSLGKLWAPNVLGVKILRVLNTLPSHLQQHLQSSLQASQNASA